VLARGKADSVPQVLLVRLDAEASRLTPQVLQFADNKTTPGSLEWRDASHLDITTTDLALDAHYVVNIADADPRPQLEKKAGLK
jgi:hypothetical protein